MANVKDLQIKIQGGTTNSYYATWKFNGSSGSVSTSVKKGSLVSIKAGATWYNGVSIPSWVFSHKWYVSSISGDRAVLGKNQGGGYNIVSPINVKNLTVSGSTSSSGSTATISQVEHFKVEWYYDTGDGIWFDSGSPEESKKEMSNNLYSPPANALKIKVVVTPVSKTYTVKVNDEEVPKTYWTGTATSKQADLAAQPPAKPTKPTLEIGESGISVKASLEVTGEGAEKIDRVQFQIYDGNTKYKTGTVTVLNQRAIYTVAVSSDGKYRARCRAINLYGSSEIASEWSDFSSEEVITRPTGVSGISCVAESENSVKFNFDANNNATSYDIEYTTKAEYFDRNSSEVSGATTNYPPAYITGIETGHRYYFRIRAKNSAGEGGWSKIISAVVGTKPEPPTTWSMTSSAIVGEDITLYWVHNSEDGSKQTKAEIVLDIDGKIDEIEINGSNAEEDEEEKVYFYKFNTSAYTEGAEILWKVRTMGVKNEWSDYSTQRTIDLYRQPDVSFLLSTDENEILKSLPLSVNISSGPIPQKPISYHISIAAKESYESYDVLGNRKYVTAGMEVYSKVFVTSEYDLSIDLSAGELILANGQSYNVKVLVSMDSGLTAEDSSSFTVEWEDHSYIPNARIIVDRNTLVTHVSPFCADVETDTLIENVTLSVYRREYNGTFTELGTNLINNGVDTITDPHPALDYARYRIVAINTETGSVTYEDLPGQPILEPSIVIQWDEEWVDFGYEDNAYPEVPPWTGSMLKLPYNVDVSESYSPDVSFVSYVGREHPVSYFGSHRGETASWSTEIPKEDKETIYALRRLATWRGNAYVREPSGTGYWAQVGVSFPINHCEMTVKVSFTITRVEGGV